MAIKVQTHTSRVPGAALRDIPAPQLQKATLPVGNTAEDKALRTVTKSVSGAADDFEKRAIEDHETQMATDVLDEFVDYSNKTRAFEQEWRDTHKRDSARTMPADMNLYHDQEYAERSARFAGNAQQELMFKRKSSQLRMGTGNRAVTYADQQNEIYKKETTEGLTINLMNKVAVTGDDDRAVILMRAEHNDEVNALNPGVDMTAYHAQVDLDIATTRIRSALAVNDVPRAQALSKSYKKVLGKSYDEISAQVESARVHDTAFKLSERVRLELPDGTLDQKINLLNKYAGDDQKVITTGRGLINQTHNQYAAAQREQNAAITTKVLTDIQKAQSTGDMAAVGLEINQVADPETRRKLGDAWRRGRKHAGVSDPAAKRDMRIDALKGVPPDQLLEKYYTKLSKEDYDWQTKVANNAHARRIDRYMLTLETETMNELYPNKIERNRKSKVITAEMDQWIQEQFADAGVMPSDVDIKVHENWMLEQVIYDEDIFFDETVERFMLHTKEIGDVPGTLMPGFKKELQEANMPVTDDNITEMYRNYLMDESRQ